eukprot:4117567-Amphidinium_carterae.1
MTDAPAPLSTSSRRVDALKELRSRLGLSTRKVFSFSELSVCACCCVVSVPGTAEVPPVPELSAPVRLQS